MKKSNSDIRKSLKDNDMTQWKLAELLGVSEYTLVRKLRHELSIEEKEKMIKLIKKGEECYDGRKKHINKTVL